MTGFRPAAFLAVLLTLTAASCAHTPRASMIVDEETKQPLFEVPTHWQMVDEKDDESLYQANLRNNAGSGRILIGRLALKHDVPEIDGYLYGLHSELVAKIRGKVDVAPYAEDRLTWENDVAGYRTKMRGELDRKAIIIEGITISDGEKAYFHYGLFAEKTYDEERDGYSDILRALGPIRGVTEIRRGGMGLKDAPDSTPAVGSDGATSPDEYKSPATHLGLMEWGTLRDEIVQATGSPLRQGENAIGYRCQYMGASDCVLVYLFDYNHLTHGGYLFEQRYDSPQNHVARYLKLTQQLSRDWGRPLQSAAIWSDTTFKQQGKKWGQALDDGDVIFGTVWDVGSARVVHALRKTKSGQVEHRIMLTNDLLRAQLQQKANSATAHALNSISDEIGREAMAVLGVDTSTNLEFASADE